MGHIENSMESTKRLLKLVSEFTKVAGYKINIYNFISVHYATNRYGNLKDKYIFNIITKLNIQKKTQSKNEQKGLPWWCSG